MQSKGKPQLNCDVFPVWKPLKKSLCTKCTYEDTKKENDFCSLGDFVSECAKFDLKP